MDRRGRSPARLLAPIALVMFVLALIAVISGSGTSQDSGDSAGDSNRGGSARQEQSKKRDRTDTQSAVERRDAQPLAASYTVKTGDTLAGISQTVGIPVERLQELNPELDPQALVSGQKIKLKE